MGAKLRTVRRRIRSVQSTMKITRAMELIAASRILKAQQRVLAARPYADQLTSAMEDVARQTGALVHPLLEERPDPKRAAVFLVTSDRGLAGAYNANVLRRAEGVLGRLRRDRVEPALYVAGRKGQSDFRSAFTLRPIDKRFLPIAPEEVALPGGEPSPEYIFEPAPAQILDALPPRYVTAKIFHAMLESAASENAARRRAMKAATENAEDVIRLLTRVANQARQAEITTELMEVVGGAEALQQASKE